MYIAPVNNTDEGISFGALKKVKLNRMANYSPMTNVNYILKQFNKDEIFQNFCKNFDVDLFIGTVRTDIPRHPFKCGVSISYKQVKKSNGFWGNVEHFFTPKKHLSHEYVSPITTNKWDAEGDFVSTLQYKNLTKQMERILKENNSDNEFNDIVKSMTKSCK